MGLRDRTDAHLLYGPRDGDRLPVPVEVLPDVLPTVMDHHATWKVYFNGADAAPDRPGRDRGTYVRVEEPCPAGHRVYEWRQG